MKNKFTSISRLLPLLVLLFSSMNLFAQPANDNCDAPAPITLAADEASIVWVDGDTRMAQDATVLTNTPAVCSGSWYIDDVWFSFSTGATIAEGGLTVQTEFGPGADDVAGIGMSFYTNSCATDNIEFQCFSSGDGSTNSLNIVCGLEPNTSYLVRVWSGGNTTADEGTFRIGAYEAEAASSNATVFWGDVEGEGDFVGGLNDWTTTSDAPCDTLDLWQWVPSGSTLEATVPNSFGDASSQAPTGCTGAVTFNSDGFDQTGTCGATQTGELISPVLDLSAIVPAGTAGVSVLFFQTTRQFQSTYIVSYTNDGTTWNDIVINDEFIVNSGTFNVWKRVFLPGADLTSTNFQFKFRYEGNYYYWMIDDVKLIETEANNLQANTFYSIAPNLLTPASQTDSVRFLIDVANVGASDQTNSNVNMNIVNSGGTEVYNEDLAYGTIPANFVDENRIFPGHFLPDAVEDTYTATYTVSADDADFDISNNAQSFDFIVTDSVFAKENNVDVFGVSTAAAVTELTWTMATTYFVRNGEDPIDANIKYECSSVLVGLDNLVENEGGFVTIYLYEWEDVNNDGISQSGERDESLGGKVVGNFTYEIEVGTADALDLLVSLENFSGDAGDPIQLKANTNYVLTAGLTSAGVSKILLTGNNESDYGATGFLTDSIGVGRLACMWNTTSDDGGINNDLTQVTFNPRMRMHVSEYFEVSVNNPLDVANKVNVYPNPATDVVNMELDLVENLNNAVVRIVDLNARNVMEVIYEDLSSQTLTYSVANLAAGTYFLKIQSDKGYITKKFTIVK